MKIILIIVGMVLQIIASYMTLVVKGDAYFFYARFGLSNCRKEFSSSSRLFCWYCGLRLYCSLCCNICCKVPGFLFFPQNCTEWIFYFNVLPQSCNSLLNLIFDNKLVIFNIRFSERTISLSIFPMLPSANFAMIYSSLLSRFACYLSPFPFSHLLEHLP